MPPCLPCVVLHFFTQYGYAITIVEFYDSPDRIPADIIQRRAPILALLGDIGLAYTDTLRAFLHRQADAFEHVLFLAGNHEFYNRRNNKYYTVQEQLAWIKAICEERPNLHFMERQVVEIGGVWILGTTLWSHIPPHLEVKAAQSMNDYHLSYMAAEEPEEGSRVVQMTPAFTNAWHATSVAWLEAQLDRAAATNTQVVVLTHHTPSFQGTSNPRYDGSDLSHCFSTDLTYLLRKEPVLVWACGHTHYNFRQSIDDDDNNNYNKTKTKQPRLLVSNQRGYPGQDKMDYDNEGYVIRLSAE